MADRRGEPAHRDQISRAQSRSGAVLGRTRRVAGDPRGAAAELCQLSDGPPAQPRHANDQIRAQLRSALLHRYRRAVGAAEPKRSARRRENHSSGARSDVHRNSRLGFSGGSAGNGLLGSLSSGFDFAHQSEARSRRWGDQQNRRAVQDAMIRELEASIDSVKDQNPINPIWLSKCIGDVMDDNTIIANETITSRLAEVIHLNRPGSMFNTPLAGHLGWGLGAAIGMKLGAPEATVIAAEGDGSYMFCAPTACHFTAQKYQIPFLTVIYNNQVWNASLNAARGLYPDGVAARTRNFPGTDLSPSPNFELTAQACGAYAARVEEPGEVPDALAKALKVVKEERRQALLNVICRNPLA